MCDCTDSAGQNKADVGKDFGNICCSRRFSDWLYPYVVKAGYCGATIPLTGFGYALCKGVFKAVDELGFRGIFTGGLGDVATGIVMAVVFGLIAALIAKPKSKAKRQK